MPWVVEDDHGPAQAALDGSAAALAAPAGAGPAARTIRFISPARPTVVLGSSQALAEVDASVAARLGVDVVRRRSGGGAVLLSGGGELWVDLVIPAGDPWWDADIGRAAWPVGEAWAAALERVGASPASVWRGAMKHTPWSRRVCLAGLGAGEVLVGTRKVVGISQRRTRRGALFQTVAVRDWAPAPLLQLLGVAGADLEAAEAELAGVAGLPRGRDAAEGGGAVSWAALRDALLDTLMT